jgi:hypothetical protein
LRIAKVQKLKIVWDAELRVDRIRHWSTRVEETTESALFCETHVADFYRHLTQRRLWVIKRIASTEFTQLLCVDVVCGRHSTSVCGSNVLG